LILEEKEPIPDPSLKREGRSGSKIANRCSLFLNQKVLCSSINGNIKLGEGFACPVKFIYENLTGG